MGNLTIAATFVIVLNVLLFLGQVAALDINPDGSVFYNPEGSLMCEVGDCDNYTINTDDSTSQLPIGEGSISPTTGNLFTDIFSSVKSWFGSVTGLNYLINILAAPYNLLKVMNLPMQFVYGIGTIWYVISLLIVVGFIWGRE